MNKEEVQHAIAVLQDAQELLTEQENFEGSMTLDKAEAILDVHFNVEE